MWHRGEKESQILRAEAAKESEILKAQAEKEAMILRAEAVKEKKRLESEGDAVAISKFRPLRRKLLKDSMKRNLLKMF